MLGAQFPAGQEYGGSLEQPLSVTLPACCLPSVSCGMFRRASMCHISTDRAGRWSGLSVIPAHLRKMRAGPHLSKTWIKNLALLKSVGLLQLSYLIT